MNDERVIPAPATTDLPTIKIKSNGSEISSEYHIVSINVTKAVNRISAARIIILDGNAAKEDFQASNTDLFVPGKEIEIFAGYHSDDELIFKGIILSHSIKAGQNKSSYLLIECKDKAAKMTASRKNKYFYDVKDNEIIEELINIHGLENEVEETGVQHKEMVQYYCTDWDFIVSRAEVNNKLVFTDGGKITVKKPDTSAEPALSLVYGSSIIEFEAGIDAGNQVSSAASESWDYSNQSIVTEEGDDPSITEAGNINASSLAEILPTSDLKIKHGGKIDDSELKQWADSRLLRSRLSKIRGRLRCQGFAGIKPGDMLKIDGVGERFNGKVLVTGVRNQVDLKNWETDIQFGLSPEWFSRSDNIVDTPAAGLLPAVQGLQIGIVTQLENDPDGEDRVLVKMPMVDTEAEGIWARVAVLDAGKNRGSFFRPEIGDEVVLGFLNDDPRDPVILGMLNSSAKPAPITASDDNPQKGFVTRSQIKLIFDDDKKVLTAETPNGNKLILSDGQGSITIEDENGNKISMSSEGVKIESAKDIILKAAGDVKTDGTNIEVKANAKFKAQGSAGAEVSSSATAVLKGSIVQIN